MEGWWFVIVERNAYLAAPCVALVNAASPKEALELNYTKEAL